ncbi:lipoyl(octanoyl) transferase LipB [Gemmatimonadota bacterium]
MPDTGPRPLQVRDRGTVPYEDALALQEEAVLKRRAGEIPDQLFLLEHPPVITLGTSSQEGHLLLGPDELRARGIQLFEVGRGGDVTYHGPGQMVGYPILDLKPDRQDLHRYLRDLEEVLIRTLSAFGISGTREEGLTGVWVPEGKLAAIGVRVSSRWITSHGFALNVDPDLSQFSSIVPCGIQDRPVTSMGHLLGRRISVEEVRPALLQSFGKVFQREPVVV